MQSSRPLGNHGPGIVMALSLALCLTASLASQGNDPNCGLKGTGPGITGSKLGIRNGTTVQSPTQYPWMAHLVFMTSATDGRTCGASILTAEWLLTAAHCVCEHNSSTLYSPLSSFSAVAGTVKTGFKHAPHQRNVSLVIRHPQYRPAGTRVDQFVNDVALVKLNKPLDLSVPELGAICLPPKQPSVDSLAGRQMTLTGFGSTTTSDHPQGSKVLQQLTAPVAPQSECRRLVRNEYTEEGFAHEMCWGDAAHGECVGDSGGPLVARNVSVDGNKRWYQYGVASFVDSVVPSKAVDRAGVNACRNSFLVRTSDYSEWVWSEIGRH